MSTDESGLCPHDYSTLGKAILYCSVQGDVEPCGKAEEFEMQCCIPSTFSDPSCRTGIAPSLSGGNSSRSFLRHLGSESPSFRTYILEAG